MRSSFPTMTRSAWQRPGSSRKRTPARSAPSTRTTSSAWRGCAAARQPSRPWAWSSPKRPRTMMRGGEAALKALCLEFTEKTTYKRAATDFSSQGAKMKSAGCDLVILGNVIRATIGTIGEARKTGFDPTLLGSGAAYTDLIHKLGGKPMDGLYAAMTVQHPYLDEASQPLRFWANKYKTRFNEDPSVFSVYGYSVVDVFIRAAQK